MRKHPKLVAQWLPCHLLYPPVSMLFIVLIKYVWFLFIEGLVLDVSCLSEGGSIIPSLTGGTFENGQRVVLRSAG